MRAVNLLPKNEPRRRKRRSTPWPVVVGFAGIAVASAAIGASSLGASGTVADRQEELAAANAELASLPAPKPLDNTDASLAALRTKRAAALASAFSYHVSWDRVLRRFALVLPDDVWLTNLTAEAPSTPGVAADPTAVGAAPRGLTIMGYTYSHAGVARLLSRLSLLPDLTSVTLQTSALAEVGKRRVVQFSILANVKPQGPST